MAGDIIGVAMKRITRFLLGILSSALLMVGLCRAAQKVDPLSMKVGSSVHKQAGVGWYPCSIPCFDDLA